MMRRIVMKHSVVRFTSRISILIAFCLAATALIATFSSAASRTGLPREVLTPALVGSIPANNPAAPDALPTHQGTRGEIPEGKAGASESMSGPQQLNNGSDLMLLRSGLGVATTPPLPPLVTLDVDTTADDATKNLCTP